MTSSAPEVMFFLPELGGGGAEMNAVRLAQGLLDNGIRPVYVVARGPGSYAKFLPEDVEVIVLPTGNMKSSLLKLYRSIGPLKKLIDERKPDIVCPVMPLPSLSMLTAIKKTRHKPRIVLSVQNALSKDVFGGNKIVSKLQTTLIPRRWPDSNMIIALSQGVADEIAHYYPDLKDRTQVIPNVGMPLDNQISDEARKPKAPSENGKIRFIACGRLNVQKGYPYLLKAFADVARTRDVELNILGVGGLQAELEALAVQLGIRDRIHFLGFQNDPLVHMKNADIFVLSSLWEGFGNVIVEAMAMATPVVSTACPHGPSEIITHDVNGLLVEPANAADLAQAMGRLTDDPDLRQTLSTAGLERAKDYTSDIIAAQYAAAFHSVVEPGHAEALT